MFPTGSARPGLYLALFFLFVFVPIVVTPISGHDWQRAMQCVAAFISLIVLIRYSKLSISLPCMHRACLLPCASIFVLGAFSMLSAHQPGWALAECALLLACCCTANALALERKIRGPALDRMLIGFVVVLCIVKSAQFIGAATAAFASGVDVLDTTLLFEAFSNRRSYGQFQTLTLPLLALPLLWGSVKRSTGYGLFALLACWWMIAICGGTRGTWLGMGVAATVLMFCGPTGQRWVKWQMGAALAGGVLSWFFFTVLPALLDVKILYLASDRLTANLAGREIIWQQAWGMIKARPLLGLGPMHFADIHNVVAAHPHQSVLQWASEWGLPSTVLVGGLASFGVVSTALLIHRKSLSTEPVDRLRICLFASLIGASTQSMVDGVIVIPYSQLWLCIVVGWLMGIHEWKAPPRPVSPLAANAWLICVAGGVLLLSYVIIRDFPHLEQRELQYAHDFGGNFQPRFWMQGVIANKPE